jgi:hypothetical protein
MGWHFYNLEVRGDDDIVQDAWLEEKDERALKTLVEMIEQQKNKDV